MKNKKQKTIKIILSVIAYSLISISQVSAVTVTATSGNAIDEQNLTVSGSNFGNNGPNILLFDNFSRGVVGEEITLNSNIGSWSGKHMVVDYIPHYAQDSNGNKTGYLIENDHMKQMYINFPDTQEVFISYDVMVPLGKHFPHSFAPNTFPSGSQWKMSWLMDGERGYMGNDDFCIPTWGNGTYFTVGGNDNAYQLEIGRPGTNTNWFSFQGWNRFSVYMKGGNNPTVDPGIFWSQGLSEEFGKKVFSSNPVLFDGDDSPDGYEFSDDDISRWNRFNLPGWQREGDADSGAMYDNVYIATGSGARARVEIGDNATYENNTKLVLSTVNAWSDNQIDITFRKGNLIDGPAYLYVSDENGNVNTNGYPITIGASNLRADVDQSGTINSTDAMLTLRYSLGLSMAGTNWQASANTGDANCDGNSNSTDAMLILRYSLGLDMNGTGWCG